MNERPLYFGPGNALLGILTLPDHLDPAHPGVVLLNAGLLHRVGPNRLNVELARNLADVGFASLRIDMAGVGDSELPMGGLIDIERSREDTREAMTGMAAATGLESFVVMGLCTGAYNAFRAALADTRVAGCVLLDGYSYPTVKSRFRHYRKRVFELDRWVGYISRKLGRATTERTDDLIIFENEYVSRERFARELRTLIQRNVRLFMIYTEMGPLSFNYPTQMHDAFPELPIAEAVEVSYYEATDHTFTLPGNRQRLLSDVRSWMEAAFGGNPPRDAEALEIGGGQA